MKMGKRKRFFLRERFLQTNKAFLLLESLLCLLLLSFALMLFLKFLSSSKHHPLLQIYSPIPNPIFSQTLIFRHGELEFEAQKRVWEEKGEVWIVLEDFR